MLVDLKISRKIWKTDVVAVNAGVEGMGVIPAVIGNIGLLYPPNDASASSPSPASSFSFYNIFGEGSEAHQISGFYGLFSFCRAACLTF